MSPIAQALPKALCHSGLERASPGGSLGALHLSDSWVGFPVAPELGGGCLRAWDAEVQECNEPQA